MLNWVQVLVSVSTQDLISAVALRRVHVHSTPYFINLLRSTLETVPVLIWLNTDWWNIGCFLSPLLFPAGDQCSDALACPCSESSSSFSVLLPCQSAEQDFSWTRSSKLILWIESAVFSLHRRLLIFWLKYTCPWYCCWYESECCFDFYHS